MTSRRLPCAALLLSLLLSGALGACAELPDGGDVQAGHEDAAPVDEGVRYVPPTPAAGAPPGEIVTGFLDAMLASPVQISTARSYLTPQAARVWRPDHATLMYDDARQIATDTPATVALTGVQRIDRDGRWRGAFDGGRTTVHLPLVYGDGNWRLASAPDALLVRRDWFARQYDACHLYFLDATRRVLVPEPVFLPRGSQRVTALVRSLLDGPPEDSALTTRFGGLKLADGPVTVTDGAARVELTGEPHLPTTTARTQLAAQLAWVLRQVPGIRTVQVWINGNPLTLEGGLTAVPISHGALLDPAIAGASDGLFGLLDGRPARLGTRPEVIAGPLGAAYPLRDVAVDPLAELGAGVRADGREVRIAPLDIDGPVVTVAGEDFGHPTWDGFGRVWLVDRQADRARVMVVTDGRAHPVVLPGLNGRSVVDLLASRDGSRLVAAVRGRSGMVKVSVWRLDWSNEHVVVGAPTVILEANGVRDIAWAGPTQVMVLTAEGATSRVTWTALDGAPDDLRDGPAPEVFAEELRALVSSASDDAPAWAVTAAGALVGIGREPKALAARGLTGITYAG